MRLDRIEVKNFRSIADATVLLTPRCRILVGINESGKTSLLQAFALLDPSRPISRSDIRTVPQHETDIAESYVQFVFTLDESDFSKIQQVTSKMFVGVDFDQPMFLDGSQKFSLVEFIQQHREVRYVVDLLQNSRSWIVKHPNSNFELLAPLEVPKTDQRGALSSEVRFILPTTDSVPADLIERLAQASTEIVAVDDLVHAIQDKIKEEIPPQVPSCVLWTYKEENLLPTKINLASFTSDPNVCIPLKHIFILAGYSNIAEVITNWTGGSNGLANLLRRVAQKATDHVRDVWKEHPGITIELRPDGGDIVAAVQDTYNVYDFSSRSDGFKRFITFLLMVSATAKINQLTNTLYLHDEPDTSLHPSAARALREELIKISLDNYVVYSTHSIFMIDRDQIDRHLIIKKEKELTTVNEVTASNVVDEEVLYNALGFSIFEALRKKNIVFEGWRDKRLFQVALSRVPGEFKSVKKAFENVGLCHAKGVKDVERITPVLELANRNWIVVSDADTVAIQHQREYKGNGKWYRYDELLDSADVVTAEDFIKPEILHVAVQKYLKEHPGFSPLSIERLSILKGRATVLREWLRENKIIGDGSRTELDRIKSFVFDDLKPSAVEERYYSVLQKIAAVTADSEE